MRPGSKEWWKRSRELLDKKIGTPGVPALKKDDGTWVRTAEGKARLFADTLAGKFVLPAEVANLYSEVRREQEELLPPELDWNRLREATESALKNLKEDSATGPDGLATRLLKRRATELAASVTTLVQKLLLEGEWADSWRDHWIVRGVH